MHADYHVHSSYSDGRHLSWMVEAASAAGLDAVGFADHANVSVRPGPSKARRAYAFNLDITYERRRQAIEELREEWDLAIYDAVEVDYHPADEREIDAFLEEADFEYTLGSVHEIRGVNVHFPGPFTDLEPAAKREIVDEYFDRLETMIRAEQFDVAAHPDIIERNEAFRGIPEESHYRRIAEAFDDSRTIPEINAGRINRDYGRFHPRAEFLEILLEYDVAITVGSDSHRPDALRERVPSIRGLLDDRGLDPISPRSI